ncbi:hypothetical protein ACNAW0_28740 [Micromonospora sp. SL1-18]|uniref:hypothetical protein n=1 Tax=Micromonospora sp. SL1-18 TaxID=3399128 RepID=UPI003A4D74C2
MRGAARAWGRRRAYQTMLGGVAAQWLVDWTAASAAAELPGALRTVAGDFTG